MVAKNKNSITFLNRFDVFSKHIVINLICNIFICGHQALNEKLDLSMGRCCVFQQT